MDYKLKFSVKEILSEEISIYQVADGTIFYHSSTLSEMYVKWRGNIFRVDLPYGLSTRVIGAHGNGIFFTEGYGYGKRVFKVVFSPPVGLAVFCLRIMHKDEEWSGLLFCRTPRGGKKYAFRPDDDPNGKGIEMSSLEQEMKIRYADYSLRFVHRGRIVYSCFSETGVSRELKENVIVLHGPFRGSYMYSNEALARIYCIDGHRLHTLDTNMWKFLPILEIEDISDGDIKCIAGVHDGVITVTAKKNNIWYLMKAVLPEENANHFFKRTEGRQMFARSFSENSLGLFFTTPGFPMKKAFGRSSSIPSRHELTALKSQCDELLVEGNKDKQNLKNILEKKKNLEVELKLIQKTNAELFLKQRIEEGKQEFSSKFAHEFEIKRVIGKGTFGIVFEVKNSLDDFDYAVKRISVDPSWHNVDKALGDVRAMAQLDHPGIVRYNSTWIEEPPHGWQHTVDEDIQSRFASPTIPAYNPSAMFIYIQMQLCNDNLEQWLSKSGATPRNLSVMKSWLMQIVTATEYIHNKGLIHRDLKPSNILFVKADHLKICDLGISTEFNLVDSCNGTGTPLYMAPEQGIWEFDSKVDIFSIGLIFAEMCIPMIGDKRKNIFNAIRKRNNVLRGENQAQETVEFIEWLTHSENFRRPTCTHILQSSFFAQESNYLK